MTELKDAIALHAQINAQLAQEAARERPAVVILNTTADFSVAAHLVENSPHHVANIKAPKSDSTPGYASFHRVDLAEHFQNALKEKNVATILFATDLNGKAKFTRILDPHGPTQTMHEPRRRYR